MRNGDSRFLTATALVAALLLSSCVGAVVQSSLLPQDRGALNAAPQPAAATVLYTQATAGITTTSTTPVNIPGMTLTLPAAGASNKRALLTFDAPSALSNVQCLFYVVVNNSVVARQDLVTNGGQTTSNIVVMVPLKSTPQTATVQWSTSSTSCMISIFYSFTAVLAT